MTNRSVKFGLLCAAVLLAGIYGGYRMGMRQAMKMQPEHQDNMSTAENIPSTDPSQWTIAQGEAATRRHIDEGIQAGDIDPSTGLEVTHYYDPMRPASRFSAPGKSPFMDMMLVPAFAGDGTRADAGTITISPRLRQNTGMRTAQVTQGTLTPVIRAVGVLAWNEREQFVMQARALGFVERLHVRATLDPVIAGQEVVELYVPGWLAVQEEYLTLSRLRNGDNVQLLDAAKSRMSQAGMEDAHIQRVVDSAQVQPVLTLRSPVDGVVTELQAREGMTVMPGMTLFTINGTGTVWADAEVPESQAALLRPGTLVTATTPSLPGIHFEGRIQSLLPEIDATLRTRKARMELDNSDGQLIPGMLMQMEINASPRNSTLLVPTEAIIATGTRTVVMLDEGDGAFRPVDVQIGVESGGQTEIIDGLQAGDSVVISGQFLLDSEASLQGLENRMNDAATSEAVPTHRTDARIEAMSGTTLTLSHPPIGTLGWPAMTMDFLLPQTKPIPEGITAGADVQVEFIITENGQPQLITIQEADTGAAR